MDLKLTDLFLADLEREAKGTRRVLERVPDGRADWKPHEKSMELARLATLVAGMPGWIDMMISLDELDIAGGGNARPQIVTTSAELVEAHERALAKARNALANTTDDHLKTSWKLRAKGRVVAEAARYVMIRDTMCHLAHHRGQLTVFLRLLDAPVPAVYGPSADDPRFD
ncbi:MAG: damage-inducible protein DinB [Acidobacteriaceae bacterium]|nr:damage-inducible protein DinB [Acidobacteriaceae bacterium]